MKRKPAGQIRVEAVKTTKTFSFIEYLRGGLNISVVTCIDFTGSNGVPTHPKSLHYMSAGRLNQYQKAITSVCSILLNYDSDKLIPTYGFGAKPRFTQSPGQRTQTSHFFPLSGDYQNCAGKGVEGVFQLYNQAIASVELSGPTHFSPLLKEVINFTAASSAQEPDNYTVLLILTDGEIHDMSSTIDYIVSASNLPLSIIIVGIGNEEFRNMQILDGDDQRLMDSSGRYAKRDIVQFVPFKRFSRAGIDALAEEVLRELPKQVTSYYSSIKRPPNPPVVVNADNFLNVRSMIGKNLLNPNLKKDVAGQLRRENDQKVAGNIIQQLPQYLNQHYNHQGLPGRSDTGVSAGGHVTHFDAYEGVPKRDKNHVKIK